jgi:dTMP kinase
VRRYLKQTGETRISPLAELFLIATARAQLVSEIIRPELEKGKMVICDRFTPSTLAYQGYGRGLNTDALREVNEIATDGMSPDLIVLLDIPIEDGLGRKKSKERDRFESESLAFHARVRRGYLDMAKADPGRWLVVDGRLPKKEIEEMIWGKVSILLKREPNG